MIPFILKKRREMEQNMLSRVTSKETKKRKKQEEREIEMLLFWKRHDHKKVIFDSALTSCIGPSQFEVKYKPV